MSILPCRQASYLPLCDETRTLLDISIKVASPQGIGMHSASDQILHLNCHASGRHSSEDVNGSLEQPSEK